MIVFSVFTLRQTEHRARISKFIPFVHPRKTPVDYGHEMNVLFPGIGTDTVLPAAFTRGSIGALHFWKE